MMRAGHPSYTPLAERMRPQRLEAFHGQAHLVGPEGPLRRAIRQEGLHSMILWGPPGTGKTTLARLLAVQSGAGFQRLSAVMAGVKDLRAAVDEAKAAQATGRLTILFIDEIHRFNKAQQDALLPHVEDGTIVLIGATTENPSFEVNKALLSRTRVYGLEPLGSADLEAVIEAARTDPRCGLGGLGPDGADPSLEPEARRWIAESADGDARRALNRLEQAAAQATVEGVIGPLTVTTVTGVLEEPVQRFDKGGDAFYDLISALHKSIRGSAPDAALYWLARMIEGGTDPLYLARRLVRVASEDIGNADPRALTLALDAWDTQERLGSPEGELALAQAAVYLASAPKSNAVYTAWQAARADAQRYGSRAVPVHLRNAPTRLMRELGYGRDYRYPHDEPEGYAAGAHYFPEDLAPRSYYHPVDRGLEARIRERLQYLAARDRGAEGGGSGE